MLYYVRIAVAPHLGRCHKVGLQSCDHGQHTQRARQYRGQGPAGAIVGGHEITTSSRARSRASGGRGD